MPKRDSPPLWRAVAGVSGKPPAGAGTAQVWNDLPQPQPLLALGFLMVNPS